MADKANIKLDHGAVGTPGMPNSEEAEANRRSLPHALPFYWIFQELRVRRSSDLDEQVRRSFGVEEGEERGTLEQQIAKSSAAYQALLKSKDRKCYGDVFEQQCFDADRQLLEVLHGMESTALCLSGGGIRSASFCLGVLQGLSRFGFSSVDGCKDEGVHALTSLDYLSTVSGGGYIGSWLMAWTKRLTESIQLPDAEKGEPLTRKPSAAFMDAVTALAGDNPHTTGDPAPRAIRHLRNYTSFLAPKFGLTLDTWTLVAIVSRNLLINWVMMMPFFLWLIASVQLIHLGLFRAAAMWVNESGFHIPFLVATLLFMFAGVMAGLRMPSRQVDEMLGSKLEPKTVGVVFILPLAISSVLLLAIWLQRRDLWMQDVITTMLWFAVSGAVSFGTIPIVRTSLTNRRYASFSEHSRKARYLSGVTAACVIGVLLSLALYGVGSKAQAWLKPSEAMLVRDASSTTLLKLPDNSTVDLRITPPAAETPFLETHHPDRREVNKMLDGRSADMFILFGFPLVWALLMAASSLFSGLIGEYEDDIDREWWARAGGIMMYSLAWWVISQAVVIYAPEILTHHWSLGKLTGAGLISGLLGALGGFSTSGTVEGNSGKKADVSVIGAFLNRFGLIVPTICAIAILVMVLLIAIFESYLADFVGGANSFRAHTWIWVISLVVGLLVNWAININTFSLHGMYRMRLMRAFLGASNTRRNPDMFTGFDDRDLVWETEVPCGPGVPLHLINATVNLVGTSDLAWAQRKAEGFTFSPLFCGGWRVGYVPTAGYAGNRGPSLATAMAISGAAFNPNMGYHSSPLVTLIMTLFNVRLGWWLPNPKYERSAFKQKVCKWFHVSLQNLMSKKSPRIALWPLIHEMLGGTDDTTSYIELTDGGHFENLGLYEMVLRRCKRIIVIDAGADPKCEFEDLGNALRKIEIDLGIPIEFSNNRIEMQAGANEKNLRCALAYINYECVDGSCSRGPGTLLYIKAGLSGHEPPDILQYAKTHPTFPHEATANQFFNESQFESYRHLGSFAVDEVMAKYINVAKQELRAASKQIGMEVYFKAAERYLDTAARNKQKVKSESKHATTVIAEALKSILNPAPSGELTSQPQPDGNNLGK